MTAGTAQKVALNLFSTGLMMRLGRVYQGLMVHVVADERQAGSARARGWCGRSPGRRHEAAAAAFEAADRSMPLAVLLLDGLECRAGQGAPSAAACGGSPTGPGRAMSRERRGLTALGLMSGTSMDGIDLAVIRPMARRWLARAGGDRGLRAGRCGGGWARRSPIPTGWSTIPRL